MPRANLILFPARVPMQWQPVHAYWSWFKNGIQVPRINYLVSTPTKTTTLEDCRELRSLDE
jgi:hypothetical protein